MSSSLETPLGGPSAKITQTPASAVQEVLPELASRFVEVATRLRGLGDSPNIPALRITADAMAEKGVLIKVGDDDSKSVVYYILENSRRACDFKYQALEITNYGDTVGYTTTAYNNRGQRTEIVVRNRTTQKGFTHTREKERTLIEYHDNGKMAQNEFHVHKRTPDGNEAEEVSTRIYDEQEKLTKGETRYLERGIVVKTEPILG